MYKGLFRALEGIFNNTRNTFWYTITHSDTHFDTRALPRSNLSDYQVVAQYVDPECTSHSCYWSSGGGPGTH